MAARHLAPRQLEFLTSGKDHARGGPSLSASPVALRMGTAAPRDAIAQKEIHARETQVRALENAQLKAQASGLAPVRPCGCPKIRSCALTRHDAQRPPGPADPPNQQHTCLETQNRHDATDSSASTDMRPDQPRPPTRPGRRFQGWHGC